MFSKLLRSFFSPDPLQEHAHTLYAQAVQRARDPLYYQQFAVADTVDGRFDMLVLQVFLQSRQLGLSDRPDAEALRQRMVDLMFRDMDQSLREMGIGDMSVGKKVQKMAYALNGRMQRYEQTWTDAETLQQALWRNLYRSEAGKEPLALALAQHLLNETSADLPAIPPMPRVGAAQAS